MSAILDQRVVKLLASLAREISLTKPGSDQSQFPILDLLANLRDETGGDAALKAFHEKARLSADDLIVIIESGQPFSAEHIVWLNGVYTALSGETLAKTDALVAPAATADTPAPAATTSPTSGEELGLALNVADDGELLREFITESYEHLNYIEQGVLQLEVQPDDMETLNSVFRSFHTFKGGAGFLNLVPINRLAHILESLLDLARQQKLKVDATVIELILNGGDTLKQFVVEIDAQLSGRKALKEFVVPIESLVNRVRLVIEAQAAPAENISALPAPVPVPASVSAPSEPAVSLDEKIIEVRPAVAAVPQLTAAAVAAAPVEGALTSGSVKVDTFKLDSLVDLVGELVVAQSLVAQDLASMVNATPQFARNVAQMARVTKELQRVSMSMRMVPIRGAFQKMTRLVRDLSAKQHKEIQLLTSGDDTELDRNMVEELGDPLLHMIRNSVDHGIESAKAREAKGKPPVGQIHLRAHHQAGSIVVEIEDDGDGLNKDRILAKAVEKGLIAPDAKLSDDEIFQLIFAAGFSTAEKITDVSGRGVGMDVVRRNVEKLRGQVKVSSTPGKGTLFKILLPLTLAIIDGLVVKVGDERYIIPTLSVLESFRPRREMLSQVQGRGEIVNVRGRLIPMLRLYQNFGVTPGSTDPTEGVIVVVQTGNTLRAVLVDNLLHRQEVVIKNLGALVREKCQALAGAAILGDGRVGLILDVNSLGHTEQTRVSEAA